MKKLEPPIFDASISISFIHEAASLGAVSAIEVLLDHGAEMDAAVHEYSDTAQVFGTALMVALLNRREKAADFLLVKGADPNYSAAPTQPGKMDRYPESPIEAAMIGGKRSMVRLLLD